MDSTYFLRGLDFHRRPQAKTGDEVREKADNGRAMACPYFMPTERTSIPALPHPERLPLGDTYCGRCTAAGVTPTPEMLHDCNLGYAMCEHLPRRPRFADAVRFSVRRENQEQIAVTYVFEERYQPVEQGVLILDTATNCWLQRHPDARIQRMAECCVESFLSRS